MAEVFGIAGGAIGAISLSIQLAESLQKVKGFYAAVKNAPTQVEELIEEIEIMQDILSDLESGSQSANMASSASMRRCMKVAQRATTSFVAFSCQLQTRVKKSKFRGGVKFALSRDDINQMMDQLERTKSSLNLAYSLYQQATIEDRHAALLSAVSSSQGVAIGTSLDNATLERNVTQVSRRSCLSGNRLFHITTPEWISNTIWQFEMRRSIAGYNILLRTYGIVPWGAPIFEACINGDVVEMQRLFDNRLASPFDKSQMDFNLWEGCLVIFHRNAYLDPAKEPLLGVGRRIREELIWLNDIHGGVAEDAFEDELFLRFRKRAMRLLLCSPEDADGIWFWQFLEIATSELNTVPSEETVKNMLARYIPEHHGGKTPLQLAAVATACHLSMLDLSRKLLDNTRCLEVIIATILATGAGLHEGDQHHTPLLLFLTAIPGRDYWDFDFHSRPREIQRALMVWLKILQNAGVDLAAYGAEESCQLLAYRRLEYPVPSLLYWHDARISMFSDEVFHFTLSYGPEPEDWTVQLDHMTDQYVGDFWQMPGLLDRNIQAVPGAWIDETWPS
ncbi:hypothetical protein MBLNU13_g01083t1 [Cladosporium sp. NU13]